MLRLIIVWDYTKIFYSFHKHINTSKTYYQQGEKYDKKRKKNDEFPRTWDWTLTTDRKMVQLDAPPTELQGTWLHSMLNFKVMF